MEKKNKWQFQQFQQSRVFAFYSRFNFENPINGSIHHSADPKMTSFFAWGQKLALGQKFRQKGKRAQGHKCVPQLWPELTEKKISAWICFELLTIHYWLDTVAVVERRRFSRAVRWNRIFASSWTLPSFPPPPPPTFSPPPTFPPPSPSLLSFSYPSLILFLCPLQPGGQPFCIFYSAYMF